MGQRLKCGPARPDRASGAWPGRILGQTVVVVINTTTRGLIQSQDLTRTHSRMLPLDMMYSAISIFHAKTVITFRDQKRRGQDHATHCKSSISRYIFATKDYNNPKFEIN